jgi:uncharacterized membrane protein YqiK
MKTDDCTRVQGAQRERHQMLHILALDLFSQTAIAGVLGGSIIVFGMLMFFIKIYRKVDQGKALIVNTMKAEPEVTFTGRHVLPILHRAEVMDISVKTIELERLGKEGLICEDNIRADIKVTFFVRVNKTKEDVLKVAQAIGCNRASDQRTLEDLFIAKFSEALKTVGKQLDFIDLYTKREEFKDQMIEVIGRDLNGYVLEDAAIDYLEQTPLSSLDPSNILDAQGIRKITELTVKEHIDTNLHENNEIKMIRKQDVDRVEAVLELDKQQADAEAKQGREIATIRAREDAETRRVQAEERLRAESARIKTDEDLQVQEENKQRQVEVAQKNRERVVAVESERVIKDRDLEAIVRERAVELNRIEKEKALEVERKAIQEVIRERVIVEKATAVEEEAIKELRVVEEAKRTKAAIIIAAEAEAEEGLVKEIKSAEAGEQAARFQAKERILLADAELTASDREAAAKIRLAEGIQAHSAAEGLAAVRVKEADAAAIEKVGFAEARVKEADADAHQKWGLSDAEVRRQVGAADAFAVNEKMKAEADGLEQKAKAMDALNEAGREHEEFRISLEKEKQVELAGIHMQAEVAKAQAEVLGEALEHADIDIVGGDGQFFDRIMNAVTVGKQIDGFVNASESGQKMLGDYMDGSRNLPQDVKDVLTNSSLSSGDLANLSLAGLFTKLMSSSDSGTKEKLGKLLEHAESLGLTGNEK